MRKGSRVQGHPCRAAARSLRDRSLALAAAAAAAALVAAACSGDPSPEPPAAGAETPTILTTTSIWGDVVANVACDGLAEVDNIIPVGGDPHGYEPSLQDTERMTNASLVVANGLTLEGRLADTLGAVADSGTPVLEFAAVMDPIPFEDVHDDHEEDAHDDHGHEEEGHDDHDEMGHDDHGEEGHDDHDEMGHDDHDEEGHDDHGHEEDAHDDHDEMGHDDHDEEGHDDHDDMGHDDHEEDAHDDHDEMGHDDHGHEEDAHDDHDEMGHDDHDEEGHDDHDEEGHDDHDDMGHDDHGHAHGAEDPHVWFDPHRVAEALPVLAQALTTHAGLDPAAVEACLASYRAELEAVDAEIAAKVSQLPAGSRKLVTNHDALGYYAARYGFEVIGTVIPSLSSLAEANPAGLEELAELIEHEGIKAIFAETQHSGDEIEALAARLGDVDVVTLYTGSLGPPGSGAETYLGYLRTNTDLIVDSLN